MGGQRERGCALSATHDCHHERPQHGAHAHALPGAPAAQLPGSTRRPAGGRMRALGAANGVGAAPLVPRYRPRRHRIGGEPSVRRPRAGSQGEFAQALGAARQPRAGAHVPATALAADHDLALSLVLERDPVEL